MDFFAIDGTNATVPFTITNAAYLKIYVAHKEMETG